MRSFFLPLFLSAAFFVTGNVLPAQDINSLGVMPADISRADEIRWFRSNASGLALELIPSRLAALRNEYCLSVGSAESREVPEILVPYYEASYRVELRILHERGVEFRRQWIFRDQNGLSRLAASGSGAFFGRAVSENEAKTGFIEMRNSDGSIEREIRFEEDLSEWEFRFFYNGSTLVSAETLFKKAEAAEEESGFVPLTTDYYRYSRFGSLRAIDRVVHEGTKLPRVSFPGIGPRVFSEDGHTARGIAYTSDFLSNTNSPAGAAVSYTLDSRGRILTEVWKDKDGNTAGEFLNTWSGDQLSSVLFKSGDDERLLEYEYDTGGNRVVERNLRQGVLERSVTSRDGGEIEEIYMNGKVILRAYWENGIKVSEERVPGGGQSR